MQVSEYIGWFQKQFSINTCKRSSCASGILRADGPEISVKLLLHICYSILYTYLLVQASIDIACTNEDRCG